eukprot:GHVR01042911.1.p1 GENE.GHVR01042911.1~~GHVR01042911.1.p1  ORF type:complete len:227 (-),score=77.80 GHVR01042911.1:143-823(-)
MSTVLGCGAKRECEALPFYVDLGKLVEARSKDMKDFAYSLTTSTATKRAFQRLPKEQRRRAMSHNPYRVPARIRPPLLTEMQSAPPREGRKTRKDSRRPKDMVTRFTHRSSKTRWLETHLWHAKRMVMDRVWGVCVSSTPCEKNNRSLYRSSLWGCTIHDRSYMYTFIVKVPDTHTLIHTLKRCGIGVDVTRLLLSSGRRVEALVYSCDDTHTHTHTHTHTCIHNI